MNQLKISPDELFDVKKGTRWKYKIGDTIDDLEIIGKPGKRLLPHNNVYEPVYETKCKCGNVQYKTHRYLVRTTSYICCAECYNKNWKRKAVVNREYKTKDEHEYEYKESYEEKAKRILNEIWMTPIWEK